MKVNVRFLALAWVCLMSWGLWSESAFARPVNTPPCSGRTSDIYATPLGILKLFNINTGSTNWVCLNDVPLASSGDMGDGDGYHHSFSKLCYSCYEYVQDGKFFLRKDGLVFVKRAVLVEDRGRANDNQYYLLDFRGKEPLVIGPFGAHEAGERPSVIWNDRSVIVVLDGGAVDWPDGPRYIERNAKGEGSYEVDDEGTPIPHINRDGKLLDKNGKPRTYPLGVCYVAFVYDYDQKKLYKAYIDE